MTGRRGAAVGPLWALAVVVLVLGGVLTGRLVQWQVLEQPELSAQAGAGSTREVATTALRGRILAADGTPLVDNAPSTVLTLDPAVIVARQDEGREVVEAVAGALDLPVEELWGRTRVCGTPGAPPAPSCFSGSPYQPVPIAYDVDPEAALAVLEQPRAFPGVALQTSPVREHVDGGPSAAQVLGYLGRPGAEEVAAGDGAIGAQDLVGRAGLEAVYDDRLRGVPGRTTVAVDPRGVVTEELQRTPPQAGADLLTHLDPEVQAAVEEVLADTVAGARAEDYPADSAAAVVLEVDTGGVVASASWPTYDPDVWAAGVTEAQLAELTDPAGGRPLRDRTVAETFPPASTFKPISLAAAAQNGIDLGADYACPGSLTLSGQTFRNFGSVAYGEIDPQRALEVSCDTVFYRWAHESWVDLGGVRQREDLRDPYVLLSQDFGLGRPTGVDLPAEAAGLVPGREWKQESWEATGEDSCARAESGYPEEADAERRAFLEQLAQENCTEGYQYRPGDAVNFSIGQGGLAATPMQMAVAYAAIANGGTVWTPQVAAGFAAPDGEVQDRIEPVAAGEVFLEDRTWQVIRDGLQGVNEWGTGAPAFAGFDLAAYPVAGKTGSAEALGRRSTGWYASYGPTTDPEYAVVVVVEQGGLGGEVAAPAARRIWDVLRSR